MIKGRTERLVIAGLFLALGIVVPQIFHVFPIANTGGVLLPMHIPVFLCGMTAGPIYGLVTGALSPLLSFFITGMPSAVRLPFMVCELMTYGAVSGIIYKLLFGRNKMARIYISLITAMVLGRIVYLFSIILAVNIFEMKELSPVAVLDAVILGIPGIILQLIIVPIIVMALDKAVIGRGRKSLGESHTFVCRNKENIYTSEKKGIAPIMDILNDNPKLLKGAEIADRVIGKAAALLLVKGGITSLYTEVISEHALNVFKDYRNINVSYNKKVPYIINRTKDGMCPMEKAVLNINSPGEAYTVLTDKIKEMKASRENRSNERQ